MVSMCSTFNSSSVGYILRKVILNPTPSFEAQMSSINQKALRNRLPLHLFALTSFVIYLDS